MHDLLDLERFPLHQPDSPQWHALVERARTDLAQNGMFNLEGFLQPAAISQAVAGIAPKFTNEAFTHSRHHNIYFKREIPELDTDHPALQRFETINHTLCADQLTNTVIMRLYEWPEFARFLAAAMEKPDLFTMDDPLARVNAMAYHAGEALNWHFDRSEFTTTLLLQAPHSGGDFEYRTGLRSDTNPNYEGVADLLNGKDVKVNQLQVQPGTLNVFRGKNTAHRVTPVEGKTSRIIAVFSFYERPGVQFTEEEQRGFYGRAA